MRPCELVLLLLWLVAAAARGETPVGALVPLDPTSIRVEHLQVDCDLTRADEPVGRIAVRARLANDQPREVRATFMLAVGSDDAARLTLGERPVPARFVAGNLPGWGIAMLVATFPVALPSGGRTDFEATFAARARQAPGSFSFRYLLQVPGGEPAFQTARLSLRAPAGIEVRSEPPLVDGAAGLEGKAAPSDWRMRIVPPAMGAAVPLFTLSTLASLLGAAVGFYVAGGRGRMAGALTAALSTLVLVVAGTRLLAGWGIPAWCLDGEQWRTIHALLGYGAAPTLAALSAVLARAAEARWS
ncbi:MAG: hypothetical protein HY319_25520 [Armatimonadetes bacterium]|nr:hypothetical protein [Armatimonadota bacterium]